MRYDFVTVDSRDFPKQRLVVMKSDLVGSVKTKPQFRQFVQEPELMTTTDPALANTLLPNTELNQDIYWHQISMFATTANKYLACPETSWLQLGKTMRFPYGEAFLIPSEGVFSSKHVFELFGCTIQPSWQNLPTCLCDIIPGANTRGEYISAFLRKARDVSIILNPLMVPSEAAQVGARGTGTFLPAAVLSRDRWQSYLCQETPFKPFLAAKAGGRAPLFCNNNLFSGKAWAQCLQ